MKITVTRAFNDLTVPADQERRREVGTSYEVDQVRGAELIWLGFAVEAKDEEPAVAETQPTPPDVFGVLPSSNVQPSAAPAAAETDHDDPDHQ